MPVDDTLPDITIRSWQQRTFRLFAGLLHLWLTHLNAGPLEALAAMQASDECIDTIAQAILLAPPPMTGSIRDDAMFTLPASDAKVAFVQRALEKCADRPIMLFSRHPSVRRL